MTVFLLQLVSLCTHMTKMITFTTFQQAHFFQKQQQSSPQGSTEGDKSSTTIYL